MAAEEQLALEGYAQWLARMEVNVADVTQLERLQEFMERRFARDEMIAPTGRQVGALFGAKEAVFKFGSAGMKPFVSRTAIGPSLRFGVKGMRGAFGIGRAREIFFDRTGGAAPF